MNGCWNVQAAAMIQGFDQRAAAAVGVAILLVFLGPLSTLLLPIGTAALAVGLITGLITGFTLAGALAVYAFFRITYPAPKTRVLTSPSDATSASAERDPSAPAPSGGRDVTQPGPTMPHAYTTNGQYNGIVYTATVSQWDRGRCVLDWPPGPPDFAVWRGSISDGTLVLSPMDPPPHGKHQKHHQGRGEGSRHGQEDADQAPRQRQRVGIPLEGCQVELVRECLYGRSEFARRGPLLVAHPAWPLMDGEKAFFLFASDPAAKQQWLYALSYWCQGGERVRTIEANYAAFCANVQRHNLLPYITEAQARGAPAGEASGAHRQSHGDDAGKEHHRSWRRWGRKKSHRSLESLPELASRPMSEGGSVRGSAPSSAAPSPLKPLPLLTQRAASDSAIQGSVGQPVDADGRVPDIDDIMNARWMQSRKIPVPPAPPKKGSASGNVTPRSQPTSAVASPTKPKPAPLPPAPRAASNGVAEHAGSAAGGSLPASPMRTPRDGPGAAAPSSSGIDSEGAGPRQQGGGAGPSGDALGHTEHAEGGTAPVPSGSAPMTNGNAPLPEQSGSGPGADGQHADHPRGEHGLPGPPLPPLLPPDHFVNMLTTRACFDLVRNPAFAELMRARVQRQLSRLHTPDYVQSLEVVDVEPGTTAPTFANFAALPMPGSAAWPQIVFDMRYNGSFTVTIECKVDIRDAPAWARLDKALDRIEGRSKGPQPRATASLSNSPAGSSPRSSSSRDGLEGWDDSDLPNEGDLLHGGVDPVEGGVSDSDAPSGTEGEEEGKRPKRVLFKNLRHNTVKQLRKLAETTASHIAKVPLRVSLTFENIEGKICAWIPPPPGDRLFWSFLAAPKLTLHATPQIGGRLLKYAYHASRASAWIQARVELSFKKNLVFPSGADVPLPLLLPLEDPRSADPLPTVKEAKERARHGRPPMPSRPQAAETGHVVDGAVQEEPRREMVSEAALRVDAGAREAQAPRPAVAVERLGHRRSVSAEAVSGSRQDSQSNEQSVHGRRPGEGGGAFLQMRLHNPS